MGNCMENAIEAMHGDGGPTTHSDMDRYQEAAMRTANPVRTATSERERLLNFSLGLAGEAGEVADLIKKHVYHGHPLDKEKLIKELGDCLWYVTGMAWCIGSSLFIVGMRNVEKLRKRYPDGFSQERSINREENKPRAQMCGCGQIHGSGERCGPW